MQSTVKSRGFQLANQVVDTNNCVHPHDSYDTTLLPPLPYLVGEFQRRREGVCRRRQMLVFPPPPIRSVLQSGYFSGFRTWGVNQPLGVPRVLFPSLSFPPSHVLSPLTIPFPNLSFPSLRSRPSRRSGERYKLP